MRRLLTLFATSALLGGLMVAPASAATGDPAGAWVQYPTGASTYFAEVQQPINSANTSNWSAKSKGGIPVMYKLFAGTGAAVFESIGSDLVTNNDYAFLALVPSPAITFADLTWLSTKYSFSLGNCHGGSLRWEIGIDMPSGPDGALFIYYGDYPNWTNCTSLNQSDVNMLALDTLAYDTSQFVAGTQYNSLANARALLDGGTVTYAEVVIDSGWGGDQRLTISDTTVNENTHQWDAGGTGALSPTCDLPDALIDVSRISPNADGVPNETTVYPQSATDTSQQFRVIDCKYQYVLSIPSLPGTGAYDVEIIIDGSPVSTSASSTPPDEVRFDLK